jgi:hypothetical protein
MNLDSMETLLQSLISLHALIFDLDAVLWLPVITGDVFHCAEERNIYALKDPQVWVTFNDGSIGLCSTSKSNCGAASSC